MGAGRVANGAKEDRPRIEHRSNTDTSVGRVGDYWSRERAHRGTGGGSRMGSSQYTRFWGRGLIGYRSELLGFRVQGSGAAGPPAGWSYRFDVVARCCWFVDGVSCCCGLKEVMHDHAYIIANWQDFAIEKMNTCIVFLKSVLKWGWGTGRRTEGGKAELHWGAWGNLRKGCVWVEEVRRAQEMR